MKVTENAASVGYMHRGKIFVQGNGGVPFDAVAVMG